VLLLLSVQTHSIYLSLAEVVDVVVTLDLLGDHFVLVPSLTPFLPIPPCPRMIYPSLRGVRPVVRSIAFTHLSLSPIPPFPPLGYLENQA